MLHLNAINVISLYQSLDVFIQVKKNILCVCSHALVAALSSG